MAPGGLCFESYISMQRQADYALGSTYFSFPYQYGSSIRVNAYYFIPLMQNEAMADIFAYAT